MGQALLLEDRGGYKASATALTARAGPFTKLGGAFSHTLASQTQSIMIADSSWKSHLCCVRRHCARGEFRVEVR